MQIKIPEALAAKLNGKSPEDILALIEKNCETAAQAPAAPTAPAPPQLPILAAAAPVAPSNVIDLAAIVAQIGALSAKIDGAITAATNAAATTVAKALAGTGIPAPVAAPSSAAGEVTSDASAPDKPNMEWAQMKPEQRAEFLNDEGLFHAFQKAQRGGQIVGYTDDLDKRCQAAVLAQQDARRRN